MATGMTVTVLSGASASPVVSFIDRYAPTCIVTPGTLENTTDGIGFQVWSGRDSSAGTFVNLYTSGGTLRELTCATGSQRAIEIPEDVRAALRGASRWKFVTTDGGVAQAQDAAAIFYVRAEKLF